MIIYRYEGSLKYYRDAKNERDTAKDEGIEEGIEKGKTAEKLAIAKNLLAMGIAVADIQQATGLSEERIIGLLS